MIGKNEIKLSRKKQEYRIMDFKRKKDKFEVTVLGDKYENRAE